MGNNTITHAHAGKTDSGGYVKELQVKEKKGQLRRWRVRNKGAGSVYLMLFHAITTVANGTVPVCAPIEIPPGTYTSDLPHDFDPGLRMCGSSTDDTLTLIATDTLWITAYHG